MGGKSAVSDRAGKVGAVLFPVSALFFGHGARSASSSRLELGKNSSCQMHPNFPNDALSSEQAPQETGNQRILF